MGLHLLKNLNKVSGCLNAAGYIDILENTTIPSTHGLSLGNTGIFQQDNAIPPVVSGSGLKMRPSGS